MIQGHPMSDLFTITVWISTGLPYCGVTVIVSCLYSIVIVSWVLCRQWQSTALFTYCNSKFKQ